MGFITPLLNTHYHMYIRERLAPTQGASLFFAFILPCKKKLVHLQARKAKENMNTAEMRAHSIYNTLHLGEIDDDVKRQLVILLLKVPEAKEKEKRNFSTALNSLSGAWKNNGLSAEEEIRQIYDARTSGETRKLADW